MMGYLLSILIAVAPPYVETSIDGLYVGSINPLNGKASINARQVDIDGDHKIDLVFPNHILLQRNRVFGQSNPLSIPLTDRGPEIDFYGDQLYLKFPDGLKVYRYLEGAWSVQLDAAITWLDQPASTPDTPEFSMPPIFERFVYDIDGDEVPELVFPMQDGLHLYRLANNTYLADPPLPLFPTTRLIAPETVISSTNLDRHLAFPDQHIAFHASLAGDLITLITKDTHASPSIRFATSTYQFTKGSEGFTFAVAAPEHESQSYPPHVRPCRLNPDDRIDFAGGYLEYASSLAILTPIYTTTVHANDETPPQNFRTKSFTPHTLFTDIDHDGHLDLIQETTHITNGGLRETLNRFTTQKKFEHTVAAHRQQSDGQFSKEPDLSKSVSVKLDQTPIRLSTMFQRYQSGKLVNLTGDFNGDGHNDLLVQVSETVVALYLYAGGDFSRDPDDTISINPRETFHVLDLNLDGISDIVFQAAPDQNTESLLPARVLLFQGGLAP